MINPLPFCHRARGGKENHKMMKKVHVYKMDDSEWWAGFNRIQVLNAYCREYQVSKDEVTMKRLTPDEMNKRKFYYDIPFEDPSPHTTFTKRLAEIINAGEQFPCVFACTEY
jgi:hypothetical protein